MSKNDNDRADNNIAIQEIKSIGRIFIPKYIPLKDPPYYEKLPGVTLTEKAIWIFSRLNWTSEMISEVVHLCQRQVRRIRKNLL